MLVSPVAAVGPAVKPRAIGTANAMAIIVCEVSVERLDVGHVVGCKKPSRVGNPEAPRRRTLADHASHARTSAGTRRPWSELPWHPRMGWDGVALPS